MNAVRAARDGDVGPVVDQDFCPMGIWQREDFSCQPGQPPRAQIAFPNLQKLDTQLQTARHVRDPFLFALRDSSVGDCVPDHSGV